MIDKFAKALNVAPELIKELEEDPITVIIENNTFGEGSIGGIVGEGCIGGIAYSGDINNNPNPVERLVELSNEKSALYERMLALEKEKVALLEQMLKERQ